tara:strand:+ start:159 stop:413 length:255 start_codon:yes stop_codon:yes gene_type:complete
MDKTTKWLVRIAAAVFIAAGATGIIFMISPNTSNQEESKKQNRYRNKGHLDKVRREIEMRRIREKQWRLENRMELDKINRQRGY